MKRVAFCTFGCRLNQYDTETIRTLLEREGGWRAVSVREPAELYVVNTCTVTARADATARKAIRRLHQERPDARILVTGCYAQRAPEELAELPGVSLIVGAADRGAVAREVDALRPGELRIAVSPISAATEFLDVPITQMMEHSRAFVKVQEGCNEACTFCIVPQTRGRSRSRGIDSVVEQARGLVSGGHVEIVVTGVHVGDYGLDLAEQTRSLAPLLRLLLDVPGLRRLRLSSIEPASVSPEIIELMANEPRFARHFHIPFQSGSNRVLARMKRRYRVEFFADLIGRIADAIPGCGIGTDVICGFPGETDDDFQRTFDCLVELPITYIHPFTYSVRPGSAAEALGDRVPGDVKKRRTRSLKRLERVKSRAFRERHLDEVMPVVLEEHRRGGQARLMGLTDNYLRVELGEGTMRSPVENVRITALTETGVLGERL